MIALDTSVLIPALMSTHEAHEMCRVAAAGGAVPVHALVETYAVLTRLPPPHRIDERTVDHLLHVRFVEQQILVPSARLQRSFVHRVASVHAYGGATYDGIVGLTAAEHGAQLLTRDQRARAIYASLDVDHRILEA